MVQIPSWEMDVFHYTRSCVVFCKTFYYQEMARIYPPNAQNSECQIFYFLTFSAERSKFLERTLPAASKKFEILGTTLCQGAKLSVVRLLLGLVLRRALVIGTSSFFNSNVLGRFTCGYPTARFIFIVLNSNTLGL